jgi:hypothetical protein
MKKLYLLTIALLITAGIAIAMDENQENYKSIPVATQNTENLSAEHTVLSKVITHNLTLVKNALKTDDVTTQHNIMVNHNAAFMNFHNWLDLFGQTKPAESQPFVPHIQTLFGSFKDLFNEPKVAAIKDYPIPKSNVDALSGYIEKLAEKKE